MSHIALLINFLIGGVNKTYLDELRYFALALSGKVALALRKNGALALRPKKNALTLRSRFFLKTFYRKTIFSNFEKCITILRENV
jgi:hypothetical protein